MHTHVKNTAAIHNLALATALGGPIFAITGLRRAILNQVDDEKQRGRVMTDAWRAFNKVNVPAHLVFTATWLVERKAIRKMHLDARTQRLIAVKDVLVTGALLTGLANVAAGKQLRRDYPDGVPISTKPSTDPRLARYRRFFTVMGPANLFFIGASIAIGPAIGVGIVRSTKLNIVKRLLSK